MSQFLPYVIAGIIFFAVVLLAVYVFMTAEHKMTGRESLRAIETYSWKNDEVVGREGSLMERVIGPVNGRVLGLGKRFTPLGYVESARKKLANAGKRGPEEVDKFLSFRVITIVAIPIIVIFVLAGFPGSSKTRLEVAGIMSFILAIYPDVKLNKAAGARQKQIRRALPDILDLLTISVEAGLGFEQAIDRITEAVPGPLSDEFERMIGEMRAGSSRADALNALEVRTGVDEVKSFVMSMVQADQFGVSIGRVLRSQADEMRVKRRQIAQEAAQKAPVKMLLPMTFLIFPALFIVILGPAAMSIVANFK